MGDFSGWEKVTGEEMSGRQLGEALKYLAERIQKGLDETQDVVDELREIAVNLEERRA